MSWEKETQHVTMLLTQICPRVRGLWKDKQVGLISPEPQHSGKMEIDIKSGKATDILVVPGKAGADWSWNANGGVQRAAAS